MEGPTGSLGATSSWQGQAAASSLQRTDVSDVSNLSFGVDCDRLLWQELNKKFGTSSSIFVMSLGQQLYYSDYDLHNKFAAKNMFERVNCTISCATNYSPKASSVSKMWETFLREKGPTAGPDHEPAFEKAKRALFLDYDKHKLTELHQDYLDKEIALKQKEFEIEEECRDKYGDQWKVKFDKKLKVSREYIEFRRSAEVVQPHLDAIEVWKHGPLVLEYRRMKKVLEDNARSVEDYTSHYQNYYHVSLQPSNWYQCFKHDEESWTQINVDSRNDDAHQAALYRNLGGSVTDEHSDVKISLKIRTVLISRPWLEISMLSNRNFTIDGGDPGSWSTGELNANNKGSFPLLSTQMIVAKDITVTASTEMERKAISDPSGLGSNSNKNSIESKGPQVIGYVCDLLPKFPH